MKTIGLIGGMSWESSIEYYRIINETVRQRLGGLHSAKSLIYSVDFAEVEKLQKGQRWEEATEVMIDAARALERGGADFVIICTNTMHLMAEQVEAGIGIPLLHIADATAARIKEKGYDTIGLLGTSFTMEADFYRGRLEQMHDLNVIIPEGPDRKMVHKVIYDELCCGKISELARRRYLEVIERLVNRGSEAIILGCTEIGLLVKDKDSPVELFDTARIHAVAAVEYALA